MNEEAERQAFEMWYSDGNIDNFPAHNGDSYIDRDVRFAWYAWKARSVQPLNTSPERGQKTVEIDEDALVDAMASAIMEEDRKVAEEVEDGEQQPSPESVAWGRASVALNAYNKFMGDAADRKDAGGVILDEVLETSPTQPAQQDIDPTVMSAWLAGDDATREMLGRTGQTAKYQAAYDAQQDTAGVLQKMVQKHVKDRGCTGLCSAHRDGEDSLCEVCYPREISVCAICAEDGATVCSCRKPKRESVEQPYWNCCGSIDREAHRRGCLPQLMPIGIGRAFGTSAQHTAWEKRGGSDD